MPSTRSPNARMVVTVTPPIAAAFAPVMAVWPSGSPDNEAEKQIAKADHRSWPIGMEAYRLVPFVENWAAGERWPASHKKARSGPFFPSVARRSAAPGRIGEERPGERRRRLSRPCAPASGTSRAFAGWRSRPRMFTHASATAISHFELGLRRRKQNRPRRLPPLSGLILAQWNVLWKLPKSTRPVAPLSHALRREFARRRS